ncbi:MAG: glycosyltransferase family 2 protein [Cyclobacteriaceae bacterium]|nr:glycosyltransferase family 2 protein [Cyclobacteriaceae bacterium]
MKVRNTIYVVIPVYNRKELTRRCLESLSKQTYPKRVVIVIDDGSSDGTSHMIASEFPWVRLLQGGGDLYWTGAVNLGIKYALKEANASDYVLLLNDDLVVHEQYLFNIFAAAQARANSIIGSLEVMDDAPDIIINGGIEIDWISAKVVVLNRNCKVDDFPSQFVTDVSTVNGRGSLYPVSVFHDIGLFDDVHFAQCGDTELPRRACLAGYSLVVSYDALVRTTRAQSFRTNINTSEQYRFSDFYTYFFGVRSNFRLKYRWYFAWNSARSILSFAVFFVCDFLRISGHFLRGLFNSAKNNGKLV